MSKFLDETGLKALWAKIKALIPTSLPANGGNADTVDNLHASSFVRKWSGAYGSNNKFLKFNTGLEKGWIDLDVWVSDNSVSGGYAKYRIGWPYHASSGTASLTMTCIYTNVSSLATGLVAVREASGTDVFSLYIKFLSTDSYPGYCVRCSSAVTLSDFTVTKDVTIPTATFKSSLGTSYLNANGNSSTATKLQTARTLTVGSTGKSFDGSGDVRWSLSEIGAAASSHTHTKSQITDFPSSLKNPNALVMQANGTQVGSYDGSSAVTVNITPSSIGAATTSVATTSANGLMSSTDKGNLDRSIYDVQDNLSGDTYKLNFYSNGGSNNTEIEIPVATTSAAGLMSKGDKANLDGAVKNITPSVTDSNVIIKMTKVNGNESTVSIGSASTTSAGMMTASDKKLLSTLVSRVTALETKLKEYTK